MHQQKDTLEEIFESIPKNKIPKIEKTLQEFYSHIYNAKIYEREINELISSKNKIKNSNISFESKQLLINFIDETIDIILKY